MSLTSSVFDPIVEDHGERIRSVEDKVSDIAVDVAEIKATIKGMSNLTAAKLDAIESSINLNFGSMAKEFASHAAEDHATASKLLPLVEAVSADNDRISNLEGHQQKRRARWDGFKKAMIAVFVAGGGVLIKEIAMSVYHSLGH